MGEKTVGIYKHCTTENQWYTNLKPQGKLKDRCIAHLHVSAQISANSQNIL